MIPFALTVTVRQKSCKWNGNEKGVKDGVLAGFLDFFSMLFLKLGDLGGGDLVLPGNVDDLLALGIFIGVKCVYM